MSKIEKLTAAQEMRLLVLRQEYLEQATKGLPTDRAELDCAIEAAYAVVGKPKPLLLIMQSPQQAIMAIALFKNLAKDKVGDQLRDQLRDQLGDQLWDQLGDQLWHQLWHQLGDQLGDQLRDQIRDQLRNQLRDQLWHQLRDQLWHQLWHQLGDQLRDQLWHQLGDQLRNQLWDQLWHQLGDQLWHQLWHQLGDQLWHQLGDQKLYDSNYLCGSQDLYWISLTKFAEEIGVKYTEQQSQRLEIMRQIGFQCEWWWPYEGICFVSERPKTRWDDERRLHNEIGPAVEYADGYKLYSWHGTSIPAEWIEQKDTLTAQVALKWENLEQRRAACEIVGWASILEQLKAKSINKDMDPQVGELLEVDLPDSGKERFLKVVCGTGRVFALPVPPEMTTALEANAWTYGVEPEQYRAIEVRT